MKNIIRVILSSVLALALLAGCTAAPASTGSAANTTAPASTGSAADTTTALASIDGVSAATMARYREGEVKDYKGANLDPAIGPRDNSIKGVQNVDIDGYTLKVDGLVDTPLDLTYDDVLGLDAYERKITLYCVEGWDATILWKGALLKDIMDQAGIQAEANTVIFHSVDGYTTSLPLEEILSNQLILAYDSNGLPLPAEMGFPFIVVAEDKLGYKWARWVSEIELSDDPEYLGYWEQRGYSNNAEIGN